MAQWHKAPVSQLWHVQFDPCTILYAPSMIWAALGMTLLLPSSYATAEGVISGTHIHTHTEVQETTNIKRCVAAPGTLV